MASVVPNRALRSVLFAEAAVSAATGIMLVALTVLAFDVGGARLLGLALSLRYLGVGALRPGAGVVVDRLSPRAGVRVGAATAVAGAVSCVVGGSVGGTAGVVVVIVGICVLKMGHSIAKAGRRAAIAVAAESPAQATATIGLLTMVSSLSGLFGPLTASAALVVADVAGAIAVGAALYVFASLNMWWLPLSDERPLPDGSMRQVLSGQRETLRAPVVVSIFVLVGTGSFLSGAVGVFYAPLAIESLSSGESGVGLLRMGFGVGALVMSVGLLSAASGRRAVMRLPFGVALWGLAIVLIGQVETMGVALVLMLGMGGGKTLVDAAYLTSLQRLLPDSLHPRVLGLGETVSFIAGGLGSLAAVPLADGFELPTAMAIVGGVGMVVSAVAAGSLGRLDRDSVAPTETTALLRSTPTFALLPPVELDLLAVRARPRRLEAGERLVTQGDDGDSWFVIGEGTLEVEVDDRHVTTMQRSEGFGEIALLRRCPRTATITASTPAVVHELGRSTFLRAIGVSDGSAFDDIVAERLARARPQEMGALHRQ